MVGIKPLLTVVALAVLPLCAAAQDPLSVADVERLTPYKGLKVIQSQLLPIDKTFENSKGQAVLVLRVASGDLYATWKQVAGKGTRPLPGIGDDAFLGTEGPVYACFRKKSKGVCVVPGYEKGRPVLSEPQLIELTKLAASNV